MGNLFGTLFKTQLTANDAAAKEDLGSLRFEFDTTNGGLKIYKYVQAASDTTVANGTPLAYVNAYGWQVTSDESDSDQNRPAGVGIGAITASYYGWIQVGGYHAAVITNGDDDIAANDSVILSTTDGKADSVAAGTAATHRPLGVAVAADDNDADTVAVFLQGLI
jgi:hypothetical protein